MRKLTVSTKAGDFEYNVEVNQFESLAEARERIEGGEDSILAILNGAMKQNGMQGGKEAVRAAVEKGDKAEIDKAVAAHQESASKYVLGAPRQGGRSDGTGLTNKQKQELGKRTAQHFAEHGKMPTQKELDAIFSEITAPNGGDEEDATEE